MTGTKFDIEKFDEKNDFALWHVRMKTLLEQQGLAATLEELPATTIAAYDNVIQKKAFSALILCLGDHVLREITKEMTVAGIWKNQSQHIDEFHKLIGDLAVIDTAISDEDLYHHLTIISWRLCYMHLKRDCPMYNHKKSQGFVRNEDQVSGYGAEGYDSAVDVIMAMSVEEILDWIMDSGGSCHIAYRRD
ncbi:hypothetical protein Tco_0983311 [Tanacetum coccineum]